MRDCLAIDLGTKTGFCFNRGDRILAGTWELATDKEIAAWGKNRVRRRNDPRVRRLAERIESLGAFSAIVFEDVQFSSTTYQTQLWAGLRSAVWLFGKAGVFECVPVATLKKFATGNGAATKQLMAHYLKKQQVFETLGGINLDDNGVDAVWLWLWAQHCLGRIS